MLDVAPSNTEVNGDVDDADHTTSHGASDKDNNGADGGDESTNDKVNADENMSGGSDGRDGVAQSARRSTRVSELASLPYYGMYFPKRDRAAHSNSRRSSAERPGRPSAKRLRPANTPASNNATAHENRTATPAPAPPPSIIPEDPMSLDLQDTLQPTLAENSPRRSASEASTSGAQQDINRKRALAVKKTRAVQG